MLPLSCMHGVLSAAGQPQCLQSSKRFACSYQSRECLLSSRDSCDGAVQFAHCVCIAHVCVCMLTVLMLNIEARCDLIMFAITDVTWKQLNRLVLCCSTKSGLTRI